MTRKIKAAVVRVRPVARRAKLVVKVVTIVSAMTLLACVGYDIITWLIL